MRPLLKGLTLRHIAAEGDLASIRLVSPSLHRLPQRTLKSLPRRAGAEGGRANSLPA
jgi:hypothetical protein